MKRLQFDIMGTVGRAMGPTTPATPLWDYSISCHSPMFPEKQGQSSLMHRCQGLWRPEVPSLVAQVPGGGAEEMMKDVS